MQKLIDGSRQCANNRKYQLSRFDTLCPVDECIYMKQANQVSALIMAKLHRIFICCGLVSLAGFASPGRAENSCNPVVDPVASDTTLVGTLSRIAEEYEFKLTLPESLDQPIAFKKSMTLERLVKHLTRGMNTVLKHKNVAGCTTPVLTHLIVLPVGKESGIVGTQQSAQEQPVEYIYIDDMESYVRSVLEGKQQAELERMTPEQREEYRMVRDALASKLEEEAAQTGDTNNIGDSDTGAADQASEQTTGN